MRLIDAEHLKWNVGGIKCGTLTVAYLDWILEHEEPTVDAVPVIRCKDCKHWHTDYCPMAYREYEYERGNEPQDYCSLAERKEE